MGQKINPVGLHAGIIHDWEAKWYAEKDFTSLLHENLKIREFVDNELEETSVSHVEIERTANRINIAVYTGKPDMAVGKGGSKIKKLRNKLNALTDKKVHTSVIEIKEVDLDARLVVENIARQLEDRASFHHIQKQAITRAMKLGAKGIETQVSGHLGGADIAHVEQYSEGIVPLRMLHVDIDYMHARTDATYSRSGVKVWIYRGEVLPTKDTGGGGE